MCNKNPSVHALKETDGRIMRQCECGSKLLLTKNIQNKNLAFPPKFLRFQFFWGGILLFEFVVPRRKKRKQLQN